jgi:hypothetical protein
MDNLISAVREQIDRQVRPGQGGAATVAERTPGNAVLGTSKTTVAAVYDVATGTVRQYGWYGRGQYGEERYVVVG